MGLGSLAETDLDLAGNSWSHIPFLEAVLRGHPSGSFWSPGLSHDSSPQTLPIRGFSSMVAGQGEVEMVGMRENRLSHSPTSALTHQPPEKRGFLGW